jgi:hypothetical protein
VSATLRAYRKVTWLRAYRKVTWLRVYIISQGTPRFTSMARQPVAKFLVPYCGIQSTLAYGCSTARLHRLAGRCDNPESNISPVRDKEFGYWSDIKPNYTVKDNGAMLFRRRPMCPRRQVSVIPSIGQYVLRMMRTLDDASLDRRVPWTMRSLDIASLTNVS